MAFRHNILGFIFYFSDKSIWSIGFGFDQVEFFLLLFHHHYESTNDISLPKFAAVIELLPVDLLTVAKFKAYVAPSMPKILFKLNIMIIMWIKKLIRTELKGLPFN